VRGAWFVNRAPVALDARCSRSWSRSMLAQLVAQLVALDVAGLDVAAQPVALDVAGLVLVRILTTDSGTENRAKLPKIDRIRPTGGRGDGFGLVSQK